MKTLLYILLSLAVLFLLYTFITMPSLRRHNVFLRMAGKRYGHRGLYGEDAPENTLSSFSRCIENGFGFEFDVHLTADGELMIMHDNKTKRMTGRDMKMSESDSQTLRELKVGETDEKIPYLSEVLELVAGRFPLIVELKVDGNNYRELCEKASALLDKYDGDYAIESFDPRPVLWYRLHRPNVARGQLSENYFKTDYVHSRIASFLLYNFAGNFITRPDFLAMKISDRGCFTFRLHRFLFPKKTVIWTAGNERELLECEKEGSSVIFEKFIPR